MEKTQKKGRPRPRKLLEKERPEVYKYMNPSKNIPHFDPLLDGEHLVYLSSFFAVAVAIRFCPAVKRYVLEQPSVKTRRNEQNAYSVPEAEVKKQAFLHSS